MFEKKELRRLRDAIKDAQGDIEDLKTQLLNNHLESKLLRAEHAKIMAEIGFEVLTYDDASGIFTFSEQPNPYALANKD